MPATDFPSPSRPKKPLPRPSDEGYIEARPLDALKRPALEFLERGLTRNATFLWKTPPVALLRLKLERLRA